jgi:hypothetical protein
VSNAGYVVTGWALTGLVLVTYWARLVLRTRRARRIIGGETVAADPAEPPWR